MKDSFLRLCAYSMTFVISLSGVTSASAEEAGSSSSARSILSEWTLGLGRSDILSTYLSPLNFSGFRPSLSGAWSKGMPFSPEKWRMRFEAELGCSRLMNSPGTAYEYEAGASFSWGMERVWQPDSRFTVTGGGCVGFDADAVWLTRNSNNPVSLPIRTDLSLTGSAAFNFRMGRLPVTIAERVSLPSLGLFFMPGYGESFYEIYIGNQSGLVHCGWWGNAIALRSHLSLSLHFKKSTLRLGYRFSLSRTAANHLENRLVRNEFTISLVK